MRFRLHWAPTSPYVRKVMVAAHELGWADRLDLVPTRVETVVANVAADNPLGRRPALAGWEAAFARRPSMQATRPRPLE